MSRGGKKKLKKAESGKKETENSETKQNPVKTSEVHSQKWMISSQFSGLKLRENSGQKLNRISDLPHDILNLILRKLPLKEAIKTNLLSKQWKYKWTCISEFILEHNNSYARALIYQYLYNHNDAISKFKLSSCIYGNDLCAWIRMLSEKGVKDLILRIGHGIRLSTWLFRIKQLQFLNLGSFKIVVPSDFEGFVHLTSLVLSGISITDEGLDKLIRKCRALESLKLSILLSTDNLRIRGANLKKVEVDSSFENIWFDKTTNLTIFDFDPGKYVHSWKKNNLFVVDGGLSNLENLSLDARGFLVLDNVDRNDLSHLTTIDIYSSVNLDYQEHSIYFFSVLRMVPTIKNLKFSVCFRRHEPLLYFKTDSEPDPLSLTQLQSVSVEYDCSGGVLGEFLHLIIGNSFFLETLEITELVKSRREVNEDGSLLLENLTKNSHWLKEVSSRVNIICKSKICDF